MINYIKSELYKVTHTKDTYLWTGIMAALGILFNVILAVSSHAIKDFPYGSVRFSVSFLVENVLIFLYGGVLVSSLICNGENKNGTWKNVVAYGISREAALVGKCIAGVITAICCMLAVVISFFVSAVLLLEGEWTWLLAVLIREIGAILFICIGAEVLGIVLMQMLKNEYIVAMLWILIIGALPRVVLLLGVGLDIGILNAVSEWMPANFLQIEVTMNRSEYYALWDTAQGLAKCLIAGIGSIAIYLGAGLLAARRREL